MASNVHTVIKYRNYLCLIVTIKMNRGCDHCASRRIVGGFACPNPLRHICNPINMSTHNVMFILLRRLN